MEPIENNKRSIKTDESQASRKPDRATLGGPESAKLDRWLKQITEASKGFLTLSKSDLVNFLIREHRDDLLPKELVRIRSDNYDPVRHINWIMPQLKKALSENDISRISDLQSELRGIELSIISKATTLESEIRAKPRKQRKVRSHDNTKSSTEEA